MLTRLQIRNFKRFVDVDIELGKTVVLIGPNNSGKTTALQALALWDIGLRKWNEKRQGKTAPEKRPGVTINRRDLISMPVPSANLLWRDLHVRDVEQANGKPRTQNVRIEVLVEGINDGATWSCGFEFDYANPESLYCRPLREGEGKSPTRMDVPAGAMVSRIAFLPPMSGLAAVEPRSERGRINVLIGEGQTAQVLRNLCYGLAEDQSGEWQRLVRQIQAAFGVELSPPEYIAERGELAMSYRERSGTQLDLSSAGRGLQQMLLLLAYLYGNPGTTLLLDEPDAHLEILRQRQVYRLLTDTAREQNSQVIAASHSEVILNEAADRDMVIAFVGNPHRIDDRGSQVLKSLKDIGFEHYYQAERCGWVLYLEGSTDLAILRRFAEILDHPVARKLEGAFVHYVGNNPTAVSTHFWGLKEAKADLAGVALFDRLERGLPPDLGAEGLTWRSREIENYLCSREVLLAYARGDEGDDLFSRSEAQHRVRIMEESINEITEALRRLRKLDPWSPDIKVTDDFLDPLFRDYFEKLGYPNMLRKSDYHVLAGFLTKEDLDPEILEKLDAIQRVAEQARPVEEDLA